MVRITILSWASSGWVNLNMRKVRFLTILFVFIGAPVLRGQQVVVGGGLGLGTIPRALAPLCSGAQRLDGGGVTAHAGAIIGALHANVTFDWITTASVAVAGCVAIGWRVAQRLDFLAQRIVAVGDYLLEHDHAVLHGVDLAL